jgi:hypothetical protein
MGLHIAAGRQTLHKAALPLSCKFYCRSFALTGSIGDFFEKMCEVLP